MPLSLLIVGGIAAQRAVVQNQGMPSETSDKSTWITPEIRAAIEESEAGTGVSFDDVDEMLKALRSSTDDVGPAQ